MKLECIWIRNLSLHVMERRGAVPNYSIEVFHLLGEFLRGRPLRHFNDQVQQISANTCFERCHVTVPVLISRGIIHICW